MPNQEETIKYLFLILTAGGAPQINWPAICTQFSLQPAAANMRWYRVKQCMTAGKKCPLRDGYEFLWALLKNSNRDKVVDWKPIAQKCNTTVGAASARFYRMRKAWEKEEEEADSTSRADSDAEVVLSVAPRVEKVRGTLGAAKRKRGRPGAGVAVEKDGEGENELGDEEEEDVDGEMGLKKRVRVVKREEMGKAKGKGKKAASINVDDGDRASGALSSGRVFQGFNSGGMPTGLGAFKGFGGEEGVFQDEIEAEGEVGSDGTLEEGKDDWVSQWLEEV